MMDAPGPPIGAYAPPGYLHLSDVVRAVEAREVVAGPARLTVEQRRARWDAAWDRTLSALRGGQLRSHGQTLEQAIFAIPADEWEGGYAHPDCNGDKVPKRDRGWNVFVEGTMIKVLCLQTAVDEWLNSPTLNKRKAGRKIEHPWEDFIHCAYRVIWEDKESINSQAEHRRRALELYVKQPGREMPSDEWAKPFIRKIWDSLGLR